MNDSIVRIYYLFNIADNLEELGYTPIDFINYMNEIDKTEIKYSLNTVSSDSVKIMNIHKSKGLEFPVCYYTGLHKKFNISDLKENVFYYNKYGLILPVFKDTLNDTFVKELVRYDYIKEEISEKIRLFYVGLTRAREKMIIVTNLEYSESEFNEMDKLKYRSFRDILNSIYPFIEKFIQDTEVNVDLNYKNVISTNLDEYLHDFDDNIIDKKINIWSKKEEYDGYCNSYKKSKTNEKNIDNLVTKEVGDYIERHNLYK